MSMYQEQLSTTVTAHVEQPTKDNSMRFQRSSLQLSFPATVREHASQQLCSRLCDEKVYQLRLIDKCADITRHTCSASREQPGKTGLVPHKPSANAERYISLFFGHYCYNVLITMTMWLLLLPSSILLLL